MIYLDDGVGILPWVIFMASVHELGHIAAATRFGGRVEALRLGIAGAELRFDYRGTPSYSAECLIALAGPTASLLAALPFLWAGYYLPAFVSLGLGAFNLLPVIPLDGGRVLYNLLANHKGLLVADKVSAITAGVLVGIMAGGGLIALTKYANILPLLLTFWLLSGVIKLPAKQRNYRRN